MTASGHSPTHRQCVPAPVPPCGPCLDPVPFTADGLQASSVCSALSLPLRPGGEGGAELGSSLSHAAPSITMPRDASLSQCVPGRG